MTNELRPCPDCGHLNPPGAEACARCNFPLSEHAGAASPPTKGTAAESAPAASSPPLLPPRPRPRRRRSAEPVVTRLYMIFGLLVAACLLWIALSENVKRSRQADVEGANATQAQQAEAMRAALERDSTNVDAHVGLGNVLYDTANWGEAIVHYKAALARDPARVPVLVDLGVCYYNSSAPESAMVYFRRALALDPHHPVAHFNMGVIYENQKQWKDALSQYHLALEADPPEELKQSVIAAMQRVQQATGSTPPPLPN
jgi:tetratricopeptide (TPR) repeat protein